MKVITFALKDHTSLVSPLVLVAQDFRTAFDRARKSLTAFLDSSEKADDWLCRCDVRSWDVSYLMMENIGHASMFGVPAPDLDRQARQKALKLYAKEPWNGERILTEVF